MIRGEAAPGVDERELRLLSGILQTQYRNFLDDLETLVNIDCGSYTKEGVDRAGRWTARFMERLGASVERIPHETLGDTLVGTFPGTPGGPRLLLIGHMDTVFEPGTAAARPFRTDGERAYGPGVTDMKSGLLGGLYALLALRALAEEEGGDGASVAGASGASVGAWLPFERVAFVANPDEEIGSPSSSAVIRRLAAESDVALVLECARANGDIVSSRKGVADVRLVLEGRAAHAGIEPEKGRSAILEAAHKTLALQELNGRWTGVTCNVGVVTGGTRPNVVPDHAELEVDVRAVTRDAFAAAEAEIAAICARSTVPDVMCRIEEQARHWPMEKLPTSARLVDHAVALAGSLGFLLSDAATGGASDANTTAGMGVATLDGLGPVGGHDHSPDEYLELESIVPRVTLLAALMLAIGRDEW